jgi:hypothetical protein
MPYPIPGLDPDLSEALAHVRAVVRIMQQGSAYSPQDDAAKQERLEAAVEAVLARLKHQSHPVLTAISMSSPPRSGPPAPATALPRLSSRPTCSMAPCPNASSPPRRTARVLPYLNVVGLWLHRCLAFAERAVQPPSVLSTFK